MDRRSFLTALFGGVAAAAAGTVLTGKVAQAETLPAETVAALDATPAEFTRYHHRGPYHHPHRRPPPPPHHRRRPPPPHHRRPPPPPHHRRRHGW